MQTRRKAALTVGAGLVLLAGGVFFATSGGSTAKDAAAPAPATGLARPALAQAPREAVPLGVLQGQVVDRASEPVAGARVEVLSAPLVLLSACFEALSIGCACDDLQSLELTADRELTPLASTVSDAEGKFSFPAVQGVPPFRVVAFVPDGPSGATMVMHVDPKWPVRVRVGETSQLNVRVHGSDGQPVDGAAVLRLQRGGVTELVRTDGAGLARLRQGDRRNVVALLPGHLPGRFDEVAEGRKHYKPTLSGMKALRTLPPLPGTPVDITLSRGHFVAGVLADRDGPRGGQRVDALTHRSLCASAVTDGEGRYRLGPLPGGRFDLQSEAANAAAKAQVFVGDGDVDAGLKIETFGTLRGRVRGDDGRPLVDAGVDVSPMADDSLGRLRTDGDGRVTATVRPGKVRFTARNLSGYLDSDAFNSVTVGEGQTVDAELVLERAATVLVRVVDTSGRALDDARVSGRHQDGHHFYGRDARGEPPGTYVIQTRPGEITVDVSEEGYVPATVKVVAPTAQPVVVTLSRGAGMKGRVVDQKKQPVGLAWVKVSAKDERRGGGALTQANGKGEFAVENGLADGTFVVTGVLTDDEDAHLGLPFRGRELARQPMSGSVEVQVRGGVAPFVEVMLAEAKAVTGQVVDAQGRPVPDVRILASDREPENELKPGRKLRAVQLSMSNMLMMGGPAARPLMEEDAVSDAQGRFGIPGLVGGPFWLVTLKDGLRNDPARLTQVKAGDTGVVLHVVNSPVITGRVTDEHGRPLQEFSVASRRPQQLRPDGSFRVWLDPVGEAEVRVSAKDHASEVRWVVLRPDQVVDLGEVHLFKGRRFQLVARDAQSGEPLEQVWCRVAEGRSLPSKPDDGGPIEVSAAPPEDFVLEVLSQAHLPVRVPVGAQQTKVEARLTRGVEVRGRVEGVDVKRVYVKMDGCPRPGSGVVDTEGRLLVQGRAAGRCTLTLVSLEDQAVLGSTVVEIPPGGLDGVVLRAGAPP